MSTQTDGHRKTIDETAALRARVLPVLREYMDRSGLSVEDFARRINYSRSTLSLFMNDQYHHVAGTHRLLCRAIEEFIQAHPVAPPTQLLGEIYDTANVREIRKTFRQLLPRPTAYMVYGPPGSQKSFALENEIAQLNREELAKNGHGCRAYYVYATVRMRPTQLLKEIAIACGVSSVGDVPRIVRNLAFDFRSRRVLLVIDEAQHLDIDCLDAVRVLLDRPPHFSLLFAGSHDLKLKLDRFSAQLEQLNSRIIRKVCLPGVSEDEAEAIIRREAGPWLDTLGARVAKEKISGLIGKATSKDAFNGSRPYINVRTLTNALRAKAS